MFERELIDSLFVKRWGIVRTLMPQSIGEHTFLVSHYANDICVFLDLPPLLHLKVLQRALFHDAKEEIFTGDLPGPNKRGLLDAIGPDAKKKWNAKLQEWSHRVFANLTKREGGSLDDDCEKVVELILKTADWLEAATRMATEAQMGNRCAERHIIPNTNGAIETAKKLCEAFFGTKIDPDSVPFSDAPVGVKAYWGLSNKIATAVSSAHHEQSAGPFITREDESRTYHDPCVDPTQ